MVLFLLVGVIELACGDVHGGIWTVLDCEGIDGVCR